MMLVVKKRAQILTTVSMLILHGIVLNIPFNLLKIDLSWLNKPEKITRIKLRTVGEKDGAKNHLAVKDSFKAKQKSKNLLGLDDLSYEEILQETSRELKRIEQSDLRVTKQRIKKLLDSSDTGQAENVFSKTRDVDIQMVVPEGVKLDELNKLELMLYSFQKRSALKYINTLFKEINDFERKNPHLKFPFTKGDQKLYGKVVYDKNGNVVQIKMLKWSDVQKLQNLFLNVLKGMNSLPNPPEPLVKNDKFEIIYGVTIKG
jgi:ubiquitin-protein ligase